MANKTNQINIPEARQAMYNMKHEVANELGITLNQGYNGNLNPTGTATRAEVAQILMNFCENIAR